MENNPVSKRYFQWMYDICCKDRFDYKGPFAFQKLLKYLHSVPFTYTVIMDENREADGIALRRRYCLYHEGEDESYLTGSCSVLEMMLALSIRCEETIMDDPRYGDRTGQWFWRMIVNMGLGGMYDAKFDKERAVKNVERFLKREYEPDGSGGLFTVRDSGDLRKVEIWNQLLWYINSIS